MIAKKAYQELYPDKQEEREINLEYSGRFNGYNANIRMTKENITVNASKQWKEVSPEIQKGLCQELMCRLFRTKKQTINMELYHNFIKSLSIVAPRTQTHPVLAESFQRVNTQLFNSAMEQPNLKTGSGTRRLGTYEYATNTVTISKMLLKNQELMDYVMYHELLHKKHKYKAKNGRQTHHTREFKQEEKKFPQAERLEKELNKMAGRKMFGLWF